MSDQTWLKLAEDAIALGKPDEAISCVENVTEKKSEHALRVAMEAHYRKMLLCVDRLDWGNTYYHAELVRNCYIDLGFQFLPFDPKYRSDARYYSQAARYHVAIDNDKYTEYAQSSLSSLKRQEDWEGNTPRDRLLLALIKCSYGDDPVSAQHELIELVDDEEYARTLADTEFGEQFHYHCAITHIADLYTSGPKKDLKKAMKYLQRGISVMSDKTIRAVEMYELKKYHRGIFGWKYVDS